MVSYEKQQEMLKKATLKYRVRIESPVYGMDAIYWEVYKDSKLVGRYASRWEAEQCRQRIIQNGGSLDYERLD